MLVLQNYPRLVSNFKIWNWLPLANYDNVLLPQTSCSFSTSSSNFSTLTHWTQLIFLIVFKIQMIEIFFQTTCHLSPFLPNFPLLPFITLSYFLTIFDLLKHCFPRYVWYPIPSIFIYLSLLVLSSHFQDVNSFRFNPWYLLTYFYWTPY